VAPATHFDNLRTGGLTDVTFFPVHALKAHNAGVAAMASNAAKPFGGMDVLFVLLCGLREIFDADRQMAIRAAIGLPLGCYRPG
jgi:hypothetical protein